MSRFEMAQRILRHFNQPLDSIQPAEADPDNPPANHAGNLTFNLHPIVHKLKTKPATFQEQLDEITYVEPLNTSHNPTA